MVHINPIQVVTITRERPLMVITCYCEWDRLMKGEDLGFSISKGSIAFHLFETMPADWE